MKWFSTRILFTVARLEERVRVRLSRFKAIPWSLVLVRFDAILRHAHTSALPMLLVP